MIKNYFMIGMAVLIPVAILGWFLYAFGRSLVSMYGDWRLGKELDELESESVGRRQQRRLENEKRLDNGCDHDFDSQIGGLPPGVCGKCGIEKEKPPGPCDHVWRTGQGGVPNSRCEKCGKTYSVTADRGSLA